MILGSTALCPVVDLGLRRVALAESSFTQARANGKFGTLQGAVLWGNSKEGESLFQALRLFDQAGNVFGLDAQVL